MIAYRTAGRVIEPLLHYLTNRLTYRLNEMKKAPKVVTKLTPGMCLPDTVTLDGRLKLRAAPELPFVCYPDGRSCPLANMYALSFYNENLSLINGGGTISEYMYEISHIIRFAHANETPLLQLSNLNFKQFRDWLEVFIVNGVRKTGVRQVIKIMTRTLHFLHFIGVATGNEFYVSPFGSICATKIVKQVYPSNNIPGSPPITVEYWTHDAIPKTDGKDGEGIPIGDNALNALKLEAASIQCPFLKARAEVMIMLYEHLGGRRGEVLNIQISAIEAALASGEFMPSLVLSSLKGVKGKTREIPVLRFVLEEAMEFVKTSRKAVIKDRWKGEIDHGFLFVSVRTGKPLSTDYITNIFHDLRKRSGIEEKAHVHQLRHLAITRWYWGLLMEDYAKEGGAVYAHSPGAQKIRRIKLMQFAGHLNEKSTDRYVHENDQKAADMSIDQRILAMQEYNIASKSVIISVLAEFDALAGRPPDIDRIKSRLSSLLSFGDDTGRAPF
jgi:integrase